MSSKSSSEQPYDYKQSKETSTKIVGGRNQGEATQCSIQRICDQRPEESRKTATKNQPDFATDFRSINAHSVRGFHYTNISDPLGNRNRNRRAKPVRI